jgi:hypothetical protein
MEKQLWFLLLATLMMLVSNVLITSISTTKRLLAVLAALVSTIMILLCLLFGVTTATLLIAILAGSIAGITCVKALSFDDFLSEKTLSDIFLEKTYLGILILFYTLIIGSFVSIRFYPFIAERITYSPF